MALFHCAIDLDFLLRATKNEANSILRDGEGRPLTFDEVKARAAILKAKGYSVMPLGCDNFDAQGYCQGHAEAALGEDGGNSWAAGRFS